LQNKQIEEDCELKKIYWIVFTIVSVAILCCSCKKDTVSTEYNLKEELSESKDEDSTLLEDNIATTEYSYNEYEFKASYEKALKEVKDSSVPNTFAPTEPGNGFSVIPLNSEIYGVDSYAIIPILRRQLTEEEMLQLAYCMGGIPFEQLISSKYSWMGLEDQQMYRPYSHEERIMDYELESLYRYKGVRPVTPLTNSNEKNGPLYVDLQWSDNKGLLRYWIYPKNTMTKEQLLQIIDTEFRDIPEEFYQPLTDQISYADVAKTAQKLVLEYGISDNNFDTCYAYYWSARGTRTTPLGVPEDIWRAKLHFVKGNDYEVVFKASDGSFISWTCYPPGYFGAKEPADFLKKDNAEPAKYSEDEMLKVAESFAEKNLIKDGVTIIKSYLKPIINIQRFPEYFGKGNLATITLSTGDIYYISVMEDDLLIQNLVINAMKTN